MRPLVRKRIRSVHEIQRVTAELAGEAAESIRRSASEAEAATQEPRARVSEAREATRELTDILRLFPQKIVT